jgi:predicted permease
MMQSLATDLRHATRGLLNSPAFTAVAILTLAMGIGGTSAVFSVVNGVLLTPLPYEDPEELVVVGGVVPGIGSQELTASAPEFRDFAEQSSSLEEIAASWVIDINVTGIDQAFRSRAGIVTWDFPSTLGVAPTLGRDFRPEDAGGDIGHVAILSFDGWQKFYGGDRDVIGRTVLIDDDPIEIIGVMPEGFVHPGDVAGNPVDAWVPVDISSESRFGQGRGARNFTVIGRLHDRVTHPAAQSEFDRISGTLRETYPGAYPADSRWSISVVPLLDRLVGSAGSSLFLILGSAGFVLLIACTNVAGLLLARGGTRARETAVRAAIGGSRSVIGRGFMMESLILGAVGGALGIALAFLGTDLIRDAAAAHLPRLEYVRLDTSVLLFSSVLALGTSAIFGLIPAIRLSRTNLQQLLRQSTAGMASGDRRLQSSLVVAQVAVSLTLLVASGLTLKSYSRLMSEDLGFEAAPVMTMRTYLPWTIVPENGRYFQPGVRTQFYDEGLRRVEEIPQVVSAGLVSRLPLRRLQGTTFAIEGAPQTGDLTTTAEVRTISPNYFSVMGVPLVGGRAFTVDDDPQTPMVAIVDQAFVAAYSPNESPVGRRVRVGGNPDAPMREIVGVVGSVRQHGIDAVPRPTIYATYRQGNSIDMTWVMRANGDPEEVTGAAVDAIQSLDPTLPIFARTPMADVVAGTVAEQRLVMVLLSLFAAQALILAAIGIYGVISQMVTHRTREIGIRMAIGAERSSVMLLVLREGLRLGAVGVGIGLLVAAAGSGVLRGALYSVETLDPIVFVSVSAVALAVCGVAALAPAARATRVEPALTMKAE